jgi:hypothetical protein
MIQWFNLGLNYSILGFNYSILGINDSILEFNDSILGYKDSILGMNHCILMFIYWNEQQTINDSKLLLFVCLNHILRNYTFPLN